MNAKRKSQPMPQALLVTGATGMVGSYVIAELLRRNKESGSKGKLLAIARGKGKLSAADRIDAILSKFENHWGHALPRPIVMQGDLLQPGLGLGKADSKLIRKSCDRVLHSAASLSFAPASESPENEPYRTNVDGTENLIKFCGKVGIESLHHISTAYVCGIRSGRVLESESNVGQEFANDYERSKTIAESMVEDAFGSKSLTAYRPSIVIDRTGLAPVSGDRTIYGAYSMYQMLASRFGLPEDGVWFRNLGFAGDERKNLIDVDWIARAIATIIDDPRHHGVTHHLTTTDGTSIETLDAAFRIATEQWLSGRRVSPKRSSPKPQSIPENVKQEIDQMADPFVRTFLPYFRDDPTFDRTNIDHVIATTDLDPTPSIGQDQLLDMIQNWSAPMPSKRSAQPKTEPRRVSDRAVSTPSPSEPRRVSGRADDVTPDVARGLTASGSQEQAEEANNPDDVVICGYAVRLPGGVNDAGDFEKLLFGGISAIAKMPADRLDRSLYFDSRRGIPGKTYTEMGGCVDPKPLSKRVEKEIKKLGDFDLTHRQFAQVATDAFRATFGVDQLNQIDGIDVGRAGVFVGHSGGTQSGGPLAMATMAEAASSLIDQTEIGSALDQPSKLNLIDSMTDSIRSTRPKRTDDGGPELNAYSAASLAARLTGIQGRREVIDAACSSSLIALQHASLAIAQDRMDIALVGGATFNNVDNLALFSQSGACSDDNSHPFDSRASGLISSEGYVSVVLVRRRVASELGLPILAVVQGVGVASDGKGKGLWAPRSEGQQLAMKRASKHLGKPLQVDYLECHATSTQVGDATELESLTSILSENTNEDASKKNASESRLLIGSVKSNLGHLLEAAGLVGMVKCLLAMGRGEIPPSINFSEPTDLYDWKESPVQVVAKKTAWAKKQGGARVAGVNAFGIGGLNAHAIIAQEGKATVPAKAKSAVKSASKFAPIAIVGRGVVLPGCDSVQSLENVLKSGAKQISQPPAGRWLVDPTDRSKLVGIGEGAFRVPHCRGGYVQDFKFDAQSYRIPPKLVRNANPAQLMLIEAVRQSLNEFDKEFDPKNWTVDRQRVGVSVGTIFGGQFSNELQVGLRLPELEQHLRQHARAAGVRPSEMDQFAEQFRDVVMERYPALLDETGGFTASTLASAIARIFNLMGGAYAVDSEEASGGLAILSGIERLNAGDVDLVICGATHRAMDLVAFEQLYRKNQLADASDANDSPKDGSQIFPGEGVASILLQRLDDAVKQGRNILGVIDGISESWADDVAQSRSEAYQQSESQDTFSAHQLVNQLGHFGGAQGLVRTIASTIGSDSAGSNGPCTILETADDGYQIEYQISAHSSTPKQTDNLMSARNMTAHTNNQPIARPSNKVAAVAIDSVRSQGDAPVCLRIESSSREELGQTLRSIQQNGISGGGTSIVKEFATDSSGLHQVGIVGATSDDLQRVAGDIFDGPFADGQTTALRRGLGWIRFPSDRDKTAWLFPGQGSQYPEVPALLQKDPQAIRFLNDFDAQLQSLGLAGVSDRLHDPDRMLGRDVWWTQLWVLAVGATMTDSLLRRGHRPDVVLGHSFGECTAAWSAGVMSTLQAIQFAKYRSDSVVTCARQEGELLSIRSSPTMVKATLQNESIVYSITHHNAPEQTVIAGSSDSIAAAKKALSAAGLASVVIPVPATFHTPGMQPARDLLAAKFENQSVRPAKFGYLSAISVRYLAEPRDVLENLIDQLTKPVCFAPAIDRLAADGCGLMVEVGPSDVMTRLATASTTGRAICLSTDDLNRDHDQQNRLVDLAIEAFQGSSSQGNSSLGTATTATTLATTDSASEVVKPTNGRVNAVAPATTNSAFEVVDVTKRKRTVGTIGPVAKPATAMTKSVSTSPAMASAQPVATQPVATKASPSTVGMRDSAKAFLFDLVVDLTGYDPDIIEFDADLEGELGVDSIKKAQLIGEIVQWGNLDVDLQSMRLAQFASLEDILGLISDDNSDHNSDHNNEEAATAVVAAAECEVSDNVDVSDSLQRMIIDLVVDQTGYDEDIIDMDADLEGELGVDSIKRAQLLGELETTYQLQSLRDQNLRLSDFPTLASIHAYVLEHLQSEHSVGDDLATDRFDSIEVSEKKKHSPLEPNSSTKEIGYRDAPSQGTHRFVMRMRAAPRLDGMPTEPVFHGPGLVIGSNPVAKAIMARFKESGFPIHQIKTKKPIDDIDAVLDQIWQDGISRHVFITTPHDKDANWLTTDADAWEDRSQPALSVPYRICQRWMQQTIDDDVMDQSTLVSVVNGTGNFGFDWSPELSSGSSESGGIAGMTKAMLIEAWMRGFRDTPMLVIDAIDRASAGEVADGVWRELAVPSYEEEVAVSGEDRLATCVRYAPIEDFANANEITAGGTWIVAGGGRGITAMTAMELAKRHGLKLHMLGMAKAQAIDPETRAAAKADRPALRRQTMAKIQSQGENPVKHWRNYEKAIEIDQTLDECSRLGIRATYHSVDVSDAHEVARILDQIRQVDGPIHGVIQGAGSGQDARFDRKRPEKVQQCLQAKIDGCAALASATVNDPLEFFIGFGSISGRFGANGHTDYSAANDMLSKMIGRLSVQRPATRCFTFHWHAWGDIGMATKPEAKLALDMIGMEFMPAHEGLQHFLNEIEHGGSETEVLITDRRYVRKFFPDDSMDCNKSPGRIQSPMLDPSENGLDQLAVDTSGFKVTLNPTTDLFLKEHLVGGRPTLPFVMAIEMLAEAASTASQLSGGPEKVVACRNVRAIRPLKCLADDAFAIEIVRQDDSWILVSDLRRRDGRLVEAARQHFTAEIELGEQKPELILPSDAMDASDIVRHPIEYLESDAPVYHGPSLQCLRNIGFRDGESAMAVGTIVAPSPAHLAGESRPLAGWKLSPATMDAVLYAAGMLAYRVGGRPSLPIGFDRIEFGRLPVPGEPLEVCVVWEGDHDNGGEMTATLVGLNRQIVLRLIGYQVGWLG
ncbi:type I polyketide synthase [Rubripirellula obstinata]|uniref:type I polyketide synthase n=1 Tax=Rubripirellula obstinata TaxID=406547 RepID=UPI001F2897C0|nr:type I polyketide synthase [Rubripirellula obstinata]